MNRNIEKTTGRVGIRRAEPGEYDALGQLTVAAYEQLPGMPGRDEQPGYYALLRDVEGRANTPATEIWVAVSEQGGLLGGVTYIDNVIHYGAGGSVSTVPDAAGFRLLAVAPAARRQGVGRSLTVECIERARESGRKKLVLHTTQSMKTAWEMYLGMGFKRFPAIDFEQGRLKVYGFYMDIAPVSPAHPETPADREGCGNGGWVSGKSKGHHPR
ncbi:MAG: GNAT family N-acetyltransferase [Desulfobacteraceae bacterium]|nr:MAG: GNAT family N-acetyltransferase [Desulfobacteraceae bacterium]